MAQKPYSLTPHLPYMGEAPPTQETSPMGFFHLVNGVSTLLLPKLLKIEFLSMNIAQNSFSGLTIHEWIIDRLKGGRT